MFIRCVHIEHELHITIFKTYSFQMFRCNQSPKKSCMKSEFEESVCFFVGGKKYNCFDLSTSFNQNDNLESVQFSNVIDR